MDKAEIVAHNHQRYVRSTYTKYPWPSVIRLNRFVLVPYKKVVLTRKNILKRDLYKCVYCGRGDLPLTIDHIIPKARGGEDVWENLVAACVICNNRKGNKTPEEANLIMRSKPFKPSYIMFISSFITKLDESWKPFLYQQ